MSDQNRRISSGLLGLLFGLALIVRGRLIDVIELRLQGIPLDVNWPFCVLSVAIPLVVAIAAGWPKRRLFGALLAIATLTFAWFAVGILKFNIDPVPMVGPVFFALFALGFTLRPVQQLLPRNDALYVYTALLLLFTIIAVFAASVVSAFTYLVSKPKAIKVPSALGIMIGVATIGAFFGSWYELREHKRSVVATDIMLKSTLADSSGSLPTELANIPDFRQRASKSYVIDAGPFANGVAVNVYFDNGFVIGCIVHAHRCQIGPLEYDVGAF